MKKLKKDIHDLGMTTLFLSQRMNFDKEVLEQMLDDKIEMPLQVKEMISKVISRVTKINIPNNYEELEALKLRIKKCIIPTGYICKQIGVQPSHLHLMLNGKTTLHPHVKDKIEVILKRSEKILVG